VELWSCGVVDRAGVALSGGIRSDLIEEIDASVTTNYRSRAHRNPASPVVNSGSQNLR